MQTPYMDANLILSFFQFPLKCNVQDDFMIKMQLCKCAHFLTNRCSLTTEQSWLYPVYMKTQLIFDNIKHHFISDSFLTMTAWSTFEDN